MFSRSRDYTLDDIVNTAARHAAMDGWTLQVYIAHIKEWDGREYETAEAYARIRMCANGHQTHQIERCMAIYPQMKKFIDDAKAKGLTIKLR